MTRPAYTIDVLPVGSKVKIGDQEISATVQRVMILDNNAVSYLCAWWDGRHRRQKWCMSREVARAESASRMRIGFRPLSPDPAGSPHA